MADKCCFVTVYSFKDTKPFTKDGWRFISWPYDMTSPIKFVLAKTLPIVLVSGMEKINFASLV